MSVVVIITIILLYLTYIMQATNRSAGNNGLVIHRYYTTWLKYYDRILFKKLL